MLLGRRTRKYFLAQNRHVRAKYFSSCRVVPCLDLETEPAPGAHTSGIANCIPNNGLKNIDVQNKLADFAQRRKFISKIISKSGNVRGPN